MFKRNLFAMLLVLMLLMPMSAVCAENADPITIHIYGIGATLPEDDPVIPELEKRLGINIVIDAAASGTTDEAGLMTRIAGGDIPDVFKVNDINSLSTYYKYGVLLNLSDYMDMMPHIAATFQDTDWARLTFDGGIYGIPRRAEVNYMANYIRYDWLEKLGMECPTTFDELYDLCAAIRDGDLDGNGQDDTYPISGMGITGREGTFNSFFTAYGVPQPCTLMIVDNEPVYTCTTEQFKMALNEIRRFVDAGFVDPEFISNTSDSRLEKMATGKVGIAYGGWASYGKKAQQDTLTAVDPNADWRMVDHFITTEYGTEGATKSAAGFSSVYCFSIDLADDPDKLAAALSIFDYTCHDEGDELMCYGIEGVHYIKDGDRIVKQDAMNQLGYGWALQFTGRNDMVYCMTKFAECADEIQTAANDVNVIYHYEELVQQPDNVNVADLKAYEEEQITQFIFGTRSMDEYDDFVKTLKDLYGLDEYLEAAKVQLTTLGYIQ